MGWSNFIQVGLALARIRELRLYRIEFQTFEAYCRDRWEYGDGERYVNYLVSAAQIFKYLGTICSDRKPERESQLLLKGPIPRRRQ